MCWTLNGLKGKRRDAYKGLIIKIETHGTDRGNKSRENDKFPFSSIE
jgi:hypothetical protein